MLIVRSLVRPSLRLFGRQFIRSIVRTSGCSFVRPSVRPSICSFVHPSIRSFVCPSVRSSIRLFDGSFVHPFVLSSVRPSACLSASEPLTCNSCPTSPYSSVHVPTLYLVLLPSVHIRNRLIAVNNRLTSINRME